MKKIISIITALLVLVCISLIFYGCDTTKEMDKDTTKTSIVTDSFTNSGMVTDESKKGDNGAIGEAITKTSEMVSEGITKTSEKMSEIMD